MAARSTCSIHPRAKCSRTVAKATKADARRAVASARAAFESKAWGGVAPAERGRILNRIAQAIRDRAEELARPREPRQRQAAAASTDRRAGRGALLRVLRRRGRQDHGQHDPARPRLSSITPCASRSACQRRSSPWNYPIQIGARGIAPALAAGCTVVLKPAEDAPMTAMRLGEIALACGVPPGVLNVVPGMGPEAGAALAGDPHINQLTFTGLGRGRHSRGENGGRQHRARWSWSSGASRRTSCLPTRISR